MEFKGTKGKWELDFFEVDEDTDNAWFVVRGGIYEATICRSQHNAHTIKREQFDANAKLIASAPELLEALKTAKNYLNHGVADPKNGDHTEYTISIIEQAIKKAIG